MKEYEERKIPKKVAISITCNKCGNTKKLSDIWDEYEFQSFSITFGYGSLFDDQKWEFDICDTCLADFVKTFKHSPDINGV
ncbi:hypothetical protein D9X91_17050 [Falsibacillus albus]|uniref:Uncharacterized protein n=1 Tax=Falsibacillus albus TaxID=2478915 RepID=A0A3L7JS62_9BACI|nr:hypothetical protein D9X91_17050 [Falsibacillus albus]